VFNYTCILDSSITSKPHQIHQNWIIFKNWN